MQPRRWVTFEESSLNSNAETTPKTTDESQAIEVDDSWAPEKTDWSHPEEGDLRGLPILNPKVEEFLSGEELKDDPAMQEHLLEPSFDNNYEWVVWWAEQVATPMWCPKLASILGQRDIHHFAWLVWVSFQMPQACYVATQGFNNYMVPPTLPCLDHDAYLAMEDPRFGSQDYCMKQLQKTLAYAKALQHWANLARPTPSGESCQLVECIKELREWMEPLTTFTNTQVFEVMKPLNWVWVTPSKSMGTLESSPLWEHSSSKNCRTRMRGGGPTIGMGHLKLTVPSTANTPAGSSQKTSVLNIFTQGVKTPPGIPGMQRWKSPHGFMGIATLSPKVGVPLESSRAPLWTHPPGFVEIASTLRRSQTSQPLLAEKLALPQLVRSTMLVSRMVQDMWGMMTISMMTCQLDLMGLGSPQPSSTITISKVPNETPTLEDASEAEEWRHMQLPSIQFYWCQCHVFHHWQLSTLILCRTVLLNVVFSLIISQGTCQWWYIIHEFYHFVRGDVTLLPSLVLLTFSICDLGSLLLVAQYYVMRSAKTVLVTLFTH